MITIKETNVNQVYPVGILHLVTAGELQPSQHGDTLEMQEPVSVMYTNPRERILFDATRDSNPFLNFFEALWILQGRNDVAFLEHIVGTMAKYSDDGKTYYGAYGMRMFGENDEYSNQVKEAIARLNANPNDRQVVLTIRKSSDMFYKGKDNPCNLMVSCKIRKNKLNIHVFNRSNDFVWGLAGTNVVQFSMLQEYMAGMIGVDVGSYHQTTDSMHIYSNSQWDKVKHTSVGDIDDPYKNGDVVPCDMMFEADFWDKDLSNFFKLFDRDLIRYEGLFSTPFFELTVLPMWDAFTMYKQWKDGTSDTTKQDVVAACGLIHAQDWKLATILWIKRRGNTK